jgi:hypothetical protein
MLNDISGKIFDRTGSTGLTRLVEFDRDNPRESKSGQIHQALSVYVRNTLTGELIKELK